MHLPLRDSHPIIFLQVTGLCIDAGESGEQHKKLVPVIGLLDSLIQHHMAQVVFGTLHQMCQSGRDCPQSRGMMHHLSTPGVSLVKLKRGICSKDVTGTLDDVPDRKYGQDIKEPQCPQICYIDFFVCIFLNSQQQSVLGWVSQAIQGFSYWSTWWWFQVLWDMLMASFGWEDLVVQSRTPLSSLYLWHSCRHAPSTSGLTSHYFPPGNWSLHWCWRVWRTAQEISSSAWIVWILWFSITWLLMCAFPIAASCTKLVCRAFFCWSAISCTSCLYAYFKTCSAGLIFSWMSFHVPCSSLSLFRLSTLRFNFLLTFLLFHCAHGIMLLAWGSVHSINDNMLPCAWQDVIRPMHREVL